MSDKIERPAHPFSKLNRYATREEAVNAAMNASERVYGQIAREHNEAIGNFYKEFDEFRQIAARRIRQLEHRSFSFIVVTALRADWLRFKLWLLKMQTPVSDRLPEDRITVDIHDLSAPPKEVS